MKRINRCVKLKKELKKFFRINSNDIFTMYKIRQSFNGKYADEEYYIVIKQLYKDGFINIKLIHNRSHYWLRRKI